MAESKSGVTLAPTMHIPTIRVVFPTYGFSYLQRVWECSLGQNDRRRGADEYIGGHANSE
jgi:hypothetical protein